MSRVRSASESPQRLTIPISLVPSPREHRGLPSRHISSVCCADHYPAVVSISARLTSSYESPGNPCPPFNGQCLDFHFGLFNWQCGGVCDESSDTCAILTRWRSSHLQAPESQRCAVRCGHHGFAVFVYIIPLGIGRFRQSPHLVHLDRLRRQSCQLAVYRNVCPRIDLATDVQYIPQIPSGPSSSRIAKQQFLARERIPSALFRVLAIMLGSSCIHMQASQWSISQGKLTRSVGIG